MKKSIALATAAALFAAPAKAETVKLGVLVFCLVYWAN